VSAAALIGCLLLGAAGPAAAQINLGPIVGAATAHIGTASGSDGRGTTISGGLTLAVVESGGWGAEFDANFTGGDSRAGGLSAQSYLIGVTGVWPKGQWRPFVSLGLGAIHATTCSGTCPATTTWTDWAAGGGGGVHYLLNPTFGLRGDVRYIGAIGGYSDPARSLQFWRVSFGGTFLWSAD
jgi:hypothetical protein